MLDKKDLKQIKDVVKEAIKDIPLKIDVENIVDKRIETLAQMTAKGFEDTQKQINEIGGRLDKIEYEIKEINSDLKYLEANVREIRKDINIVKENSINQHEAIKELELRVTTLEKKVGIKSV